MRSLRCVCFLIVSLLSVLILSGCGLGGGGGAVRTSDVPTSETTTNDTTTDETPTGDPGTAADSTPVALPTDCRGSGDPLPDATEITDVRLSLSTDWTHTTLLVKNTGTQSAVVVPDRNLRTTLATAPYADPTDLKSLTAIEAVARAANPNGVPGMPPGVPLNQVFFVPPGWAVCATTFDLTVPAEIRYLHDKASTAEYFVATALFSALAKRLTPTALKQGQTLVACAQGVGGLVSQQPAADDMSLYIKAFKTGTTCHDSYHILLGDSTEAEQTESDVLKLLRRAPQLLEDDRKLFVALAHR